MIEQLLPAASTFAGHVDGLFTLIFVLVGFWLLLAEFVFFGLIFRYKKKEGQPASYYTGEEKHLKRWITIPHVLVLICDIVIVIGAVRVWYEIKQDLPPAEQTVRVVGQQWAWTFVHPGPDGRIDTADDITAIDELHLQVDTLYHYKLEARDVLHSFSIPAFRLKQDAVPGRVITGWFEPTRIGRYDFQCAEICGIGHGVMAASVIVESAEDHAAWMEQEPPITLAALPAPQPAKD